MGVQRELHTNLSSGLGMKEVCMSSSWWSGSVALSCVLIQTSQTLGSLLGFSIKQESLTLSLSLYCLVTVGFWLLNHGMCPHLTHPSSFPPSTSTAQRASESTSSHIPVGQAILQILTIAIAKSKLFFMQQNFYNPWTCNPNAS